jgi:hypothetical protein
MIEGGSAMVYEAIVQSKSLKRIYERGGSRAPPPKRSGGAFDG